MKYYNLEKKAYQDINEKNKGITFLYENVLGRIILKLFISKPIRFFYNFYATTFLSIPKIKRFIKKNNIDMSIYEDTKYHSFNEFFMRKIKSGARPISKGLIAPCDSCLSAYKITNDSAFKIKNSIYTVSELIGEASSKFLDGDILVFRLGVTDYHHYIYIDEGSVLSKKRIKGKFHTVQPLAFKKHRVFLENERVVTKLMTKNYGEIVAVEVGAMMIGKIVNEEVDTFKKGDERGHFEFGGSTVILIFPKNKIKLNKTIYENSLKDIETIVKMGASLE